MDLRIVSSPSDFVDGKILPPHCPYAHIKSSLPPLGRAKFTGQTRATLQGGVATEVTQLNIESLWTGGPFSNDSYTGGNRPPDEQAELAQGMQVVRAEVFGKGTTNNFTQFGTDAGAAYGSYSGAGYLISNVNTTGSVSGYGRYLDLDQGIARTTWTQSGTTYLRSTFCSHPTKTCIQHIAPSAPGPLPNVSFAFSSALENNMPAPNITCSGSDTLRIRGYTETTKGMLWEVIARVRMTPASSAAAVGQVQCVQLPVTSGSPPNATLQVAGGSAKEVWISWFGDTDYDMNAGTPEANFSFKGVDPHDSVLATISASTAGSFTYDRLLSQHVADHKAALNPGFSLSLNQTPNLNTPTDAIRNAYRADTGDKYLEWLLFNYARYMLVASSRSKLPANLQGKWANGYTNSWGSDYHANINLQMNYWAAESIDLDVTSSLWNYMEKTWVPRGKLTAQILYNITRGWVTHQEMNTFGHTGQKLTPYWSNFPEANAWMSLHIWDHFDFTNDVAWFKAQGYPLLKGAASFHLDKLIPDTRFNDTTLVVNPCNSPEQDPTTMGCAIAQQTIWQLFNAIEKGFAASGDTDQAFLAEVKAKRDQMDKGIHVGSWSQFQEWKVDMDSATNTHRHLSLLIGLYPGYAIASYSPTLQPVRGKNYTRQQVLDATSVILKARGNGTGTDADSGWEKAWRAACWAQLGDGQTFYHELSYAIERNFGANLFSLYQPGEVPGTFQIDANLAYPGALLNALLQAPDTATYSTPLVVTVLPALPTQWPTGSVKGLRIRGGITVDLAWDAGKPKSVSLRVDRSIVSRPVQVVYGGKTLLEFTTAPGMSKTITSF